MKINREGDNKSWLYFKYESLGTFCFVHEIIGHSERDCNVVSANPNKIIDNSYGTWLRAPSRNDKNNNGSIWLRNEADGESVWGRRTTWRRIQTLDMVVKEKDSWRLTKILVRLKSYHNKSRRLIGKMMMFLLKFKIMGAGVKNLLLWVKILQWLIRNVSAWMRI